MSIFPSFGRGGVQWGGTVSGPSDLAQIIQGEASTPEGQFAVASTIQNRINDGSWGPGINSVVTPSQFNGASFSGPPSASATAFANAIYAGNLSDYGNTGNATFYSAASSPYYGNGATQITAGGANIGGNLYMTGTNQSGPTQNGFVAPAYGGTLTPTTVTGTGSDALNQGAGDPLGFSVTQDSGTASSIGNDQGTPSLGGGLTGAAPTDNSAAGMNPNSAPFSGDITNISVAGVNAPASAGVSTAAAPQGTAPQAQGGTGTGGPPIMITNAQQIGDQAAGTIAQGANTAANTLSKSVTQAGQDVQSAEGNFAAAGTSWLGSSFSAITNLFVRGGFVLLGLVLIVGAFVFFYAERQTGATANG